MVTVLDREFESEEELVHKLTSEVNLRKLRDEGSLDYIPYFREVFRLYREGGISQKAHDEIVSQNNLGWLEEMTSPISVEDLPQYRMYDDSPVTEERFWNYIKSAHIVALKKCHLELMRWSSEYDKADRESFRDAGQENEVDKDEWIKGIRESYDEVRKGLKDQIRSICWECRRRGFDGANKIMELFNDMLDRHDAVLDAAANRKTLLPMDMDRLTRAPGHLMSPEERLFELIFYTIRD